MANINWKEQNYRVFKNTNDGQKENTPAELIGHIEQVDFEQGLCVMNVNGCKNQINIGDLVKGILSGAGCVSNPSALEDWKGFDVEKRAQRKMVFTERKGQLIVQIEDENIKIEYSFGYVIGKRKVNKGVKNPSNNWVIMEIDAFNEYLKESNLTELNNDEHYKLTKMLRGF